MTPYSCYIHDNKSVVRPIFTLTYCQDLNPVFHFLLSVGKLPQRSSLWALSLSLSAVNLSESAQGMMAPAQLTQIFVTAATALRTMLGHHLSFLPVSF